MEAFALSPAAPRLALPQRLLSDDRLLRLVAAGNPQAFGAVYARYHAPLYAYCRSIVRDPDDARDALQNTMLKALAALGRGEDRELALKPWLFRIAHNESISLLRRRRPSEPLTDALSPPVAGADREVIARERLGQLVEDLRELPERQRSALIMREVNDLSYEDIAAALAISEGAARQTVFEARTALVEYGEGRDVACEHIRRSISDGDGRALRARRMRAHLRSCDACRDFQTTLKVRRRDLAILAPGLSGGAVLGLLQGVIGTGAVAGGASAAAGGAGLLGGSTSALLASGAAKGVVALVVVTAAGAGAARIAEPVHHHTPTVRPAVPRAVPAVTAHARPAAPRLAAGRRVAVVARHHTASTVHAAQRGGAWSEGRANRPVRNERQGGAAHHAPDQQRPAFDGRRSDAQRSQRAADPPPADHDRGAQPVQDSSSTPVGSDRNDVAQTRPPLAQREPSPYAVTSSSPAAPATTAPAPAGTAEAPVQ